MAIEDIATNVPLGRQHRFAPGNFITHVDSVQGLQGALLILGVNWRVIQYVDNTGITNDDRVELLPTYRVRDFYGDEQGDILDTDDLIYVQMDQYSRDHWHAHQSNGNFRVHVQISERLS